MEAPSPERYDSLFVTPHGDDVVLACPARLRSEVERGRRVLVLALFEEVGRETNAACAVRELGAEYAAAGLPAPDERMPLDEAAREERDAPIALEAARLLSDVGPRTQAMHVFAPLGLGASRAHELVYRAAVRAFASEAGRNLFLFEERPEAFVPGAVRTRLALLGARLPPAAQRAAAASSSLRHLWSCNEPRRLRGEPATFGERMAALSEARRRLRRARPWNPLRAFGPRLQPVLSVADEEAMRRSQALALSLLPFDAKGRARSAQRFNALALASAKQLGGVYHAERLWLFLPSSDGLPEVQHPLELALS
jgi:hypothetical protein